MKIYNQKSSDTLDSYIDLIKQAQMRTLLKALTEMGPAATKGLDDEAATAAAKVLADMKAGGKPITESSLMKELRNQGIEEAQARAALKTMMSNAEAGTKAVSGFMRESGGSVSLVITDTKKLMSEVSKLEKALAEAKAKGTAMYGQRRLSAGALAKKLEGVKKQAADRLAKVKELKSELKEAQKAGKASAQEVAQLSKQLDAAQAQLLKTEKQIAKNIAGIAKQMDEMSEILKGLPPELQRIAKEHKEMKETLGQTNTMLQALEKMVKEGKVSQEAAAPVAKSLKASKEAAEEGAKKTAATLAKQGDDVAAEVAKEGAKAEARGSSKAWAAIKGIVGFSASNTGKLLNYFHVPGMIALAATVAGVSLAAWWVYTRMFPDEARENIAEIEAAINDALVKTRALQFQQGSFGSQETEDLIAELEDNLRTLPMAMNQDETARQAFENLDELSLMISQYLGSPEIAQSLVSPDGWGEATNSLSNLRNVLKQKQEWIDGVIRNIQEQYPDEVAQASGPIQVPDQGQGAGEAEGEPTATVDAYGMNLDISHLGPRERSAAPRIVARVLNTPTGMAFVDPANYWGGFLAKTGDPEKDYVQAIKYLYKNDIQNQGQLRRHLRQVMPRISRAKKSGYRNALKQYRNNPYRGPKTAGLNQKNNDFYNLTSFSINKEPFPMKMSDNFANRYYGDALKGVSDSYAKSYITGLRSMYNPELGRRDADMGELYHLHDETGPDLVRDAHPKAIDIADAMGKGGLVENGLEQKQHMEDVALSTPSGNFRSKHASVLSDLVKLAHEADENGDSESTDLIDSFIKELVTSREK